MMINAGCESRNNGCGPLQTDSSMKSDIMQNAGAFLEEKIKCPEITITSSEHHRRESIRKRSSSFKQERQKRDSLRTIRRPSKFMIITPDPEIQQEQKELESKLNMLLKNQNYPIDPDNTFGISPDDKDGDKSAKVISE